MPGITLTPLEGCSRMDSLELSRPSGQVQLCDDSLIYNDPPIYPGDVLHVDVRRKPPPSGLVLAVIDGRIMVRHLCQTPNGLLRLEARNLDYPPIWRRPDQVAIIGLVQTHPVAHHLYLEGQKVS